MYYDIIRIEQHAVCLLKPSPQTRNDKDKNYVLNTRTEETKKT